MSETLPRYEKLERRYSSVAPKWQSKLHAMGYPDAYRELLLHHIPRGSASQWNVLDAGTGTGAFSEALIDVAGPLPRIDLLDISADMLAEAKNRLAPNIADVRTRCGSLETLRGDAKYDLILCAHVVEHCSDHLQVLEILRGALKPGGRLILVASKPHWCTSLIRLIWGHKAFRPDEMTMLLNLAGFSEITQFAFKNGPPCRTSCGYSACNPK